MSDAREERSTVGQFLSGIGALRDGPSGHIYQEWERWLSAQARRVADNPNVGAQLGRALGASAHWKSLVESAVQAASTGLARRDAVEQRERRVAALEAQLKRLEGR